MGSRKVSTLSLSLSHEKLMHTTISGETFNHLLPLKDFIFAHTFGDGFVLCVDAIEDRTVETPCRCKYANYGFVERGVVNMRLMAKNMVKPLAWEIEVLNLLTSHSQSKMQGKLVGERWGVFKERTTDILSLEDTKAIVHALRTSPLADESIADHLLTVLRQILSGECQLRTGPGIDFGLSTLVKAIIVSSYSRQAG